MKNLYSIKDLEWNDSDSMSFSTIGKFHYMIELSNGRYYCSDRGHDFTSKATLQMAKVACQKHYEEQLKQHLKPALIMGEVANVPKVLRS